MTSEKIEALTAQITQELSIKEVTALANKLINFVLANLEPDPIDLLFAEEDPSQPTP